MIIIGNVASEAWPGFESVSKFAVVEEATLSQVGTSGHKWTQGFGNVSMVRKRVKVSKACQYNNIFENLSSDLEVHIIKFGFCFLKCLFR